MKTLAITILLLFVNDIAFSQSSVKDLENYMQSIRISPYAPAPQSILTDSKNEVKLVEVLERYFADTIETVRAKAYYMTKQIGQKSNGAALRKRIVHHLTLAVGDRSSGISGTASRGLTVFAPDDFTSIERDSISAYLKTSTPHLSDILKLAGYLKLNSQQGKINDLIRGTTSSQNKWAARLALARMGDPNAITFIVSRLSTAPINDDLVYEVVPDLAYTRQKEIFKFLHTIILSDAKTCQSPDPDSNEKIKCGYRVMEAIAPVINGFPFSVDSEGSLNTDDYEGALTQVRKWLDENADYTIKSESF